MELGAMPGEQKPQVLVPNTMVRVSEWYASAHDPPEWYLKLQDGRGWIPYRADLPGGKVEVVEPAGEKNKFVISNVESLIGNSGHKVTFGLLVEMGSRTEFGLQDTRKTIKLNFSHFKRTESCQLIVQGCFYVAEGIVDNAQNVLHVIHITRY